MITGREVCVPHYRSVQWAPFARCARLSSALIGGWASGARCVRLSSALIKGTQVRGVLKVSIGHSSDAGDSAPIAPLEAPRPPLSGSYSLVLSLAQPCFPCEDLHFCHLLLCTPHVLRNAQVPSCMYIYTSISGLISISV